MNQVKKIQVSQLGRVLYSREAATALMHLAAASAPQNICLDFSNVEFVSRSFADQFYKEHNNGQLPFLTIENVSPEVLTMLEIVHQTQQASDRITTRFPSQTIASKKAQLEFFMAM